MSRKVIGALSAGSGAFVHGHTYHAHPIACGAALEVQRIIREEGLLANVHAMGARLEATLLDRFGNYGMWATSVGAACSTRWTGG